MEARKVQIKLFVDAARDAALDPDAFVPVFHRWIREKTVNDVLIDVTDYAHVHHAPAVLLVGHASDYALDFAEGRAGLLYSRKRDAPSDAAEAIVDALGRALFSCKKLEEEKSFRTPLRFRGDEILFRLNDRLRAPNTDETFAKVEPVLRSVFGKLYGSGASFDRVGTSRELFTVRVKGNETAGVSELLKRIS